MFFSFVYNIECDSTSKLFISITLHWFYEPAKYSTLGLLSTAFASGWIKSINCFQFFLLTFIKIDIVCDCGWILWMMRQFVVDYWCFFQWDHERGHGQWYPPLLLPRKQSCITQSLLFHAMHAHWNGGELLPFDSRRWQSWPMFFCEFQLPRPNPNASIRLLVTS